MQRVCELPPVIMVQLHNEVYSLDVWTLWSAVPRACSITPSKRYIMQGRVQYLLPTQRERRFQKDALSCIIWRPRGKHNSLVMITRAIANHRQKSEIRGCQGERKGAQRERKRERVPALMSYQWLSWGRASVAVFRNVTLFHPTLMFISFSVWLMTGSLKRREKRGKQALWGSCHTWKLSRVTVMYSRVVAMKTNLQLPPNNNKKATGRDTERHIKTIVPCSFEVFPKDFKCRSVLRITFN